MHDVLHCEPSNGSDDRFGSISTEWGYRRHVRFTPVSDLTADIDGGPVRAMNGHRAELNWTADFATQH